MKKEKKAEILRVKKRIFIGVLFSFWFKVNFQGNRLKGRWKFMARVLLPLQYGNVTFSLQGWFLVWKSNSINFQGNLAEFVRIRQCKTVDCYRSLPSLNFLTSKLIGFRKNSQILPILLSWIPSFIFSNLKKLKFDKNIPNF